MMQLELSISEFLMLLTFLGTGGLILIFSIASLRHLLRLYRRRKTHLRCRICGYQFICKEKESYCPHCQARNR